MPKVDFSKWTFERMKEMCSQIQNTEHCGKCKIFENTVECWKRFGGHIPSLWELDKTEEKGVNQ